MSNTPAPNFLPSSVFIVVGSFMFLLGVLNLVLNWGGPAMGASLILLIGGPIMALYGLRQRKL